MTGVLTLRLILAYALGPLDYSVSGGNTPAQDVTHIIAY